MKTGKKAAVDWASLGFTYTKTAWRFAAGWKDGSWNDGLLVRSNRLKISEASTAIHYGQACFEGLKAYTAKDGRILLFRPDENAKRMQRSCDRLVMPRFPEDRFIEACKKVVRANYKWLPPYGTGASLYLRPYLMGVGDNLGVRSAPEFHFGIFCSPVGPYFKKGLSPVSFMVSEFDRAAPQGTGQAKVGGNYAASLLSNKIAKDKGYADAIYLDPSTHTKIEEVGAANFFGITKDNKFITPNSPSILQSITRISLLHVAREYLGLQVEERDVFVDRLDEFAEAGACGTAAVISPIASICHEDREHVFYDKEKVGPVSRKLYDTLVGIQIGDIKAPEGWVFEV